MSEWTPADTPQPPPPKCEDCQYLSVYAGLYSVEMCCHPKTVLLNIAYGGAGPVPYITARKINHACGPDGKRFEPAK